MKMRIFLFLLTGILCASSLLGDPPPRSVARELGYSDELLERLSPTQGKRSLPDPNYEAPRNPGGSVPTENLLPPKYYQSAESASMIPFLLTLQKKSPQSPKITRKLALTCLKAGQPREALHWFTQTFHRDRSDFSALWNMAALSHRLGDPKATRAYLNEYSKIDPYSAWGKMAREYLESDPWSAPNMSSGFSQTLPRFGYVETATGSAQDSSLMVISGKEIDPRSFSTEESRFPVDNPLNPNRAIPQVTQIGPAKKVPGKSGSASSSPPSDSGGKPSLKKAFIETLPEKPEVKTRPVVPQTDPQPKQQPPAQPASVQPPPGQPPAPASTPTAAPVASGTK